MKRLLCVAATMAFATCVGFAAFAADDTTLNFRAVLSPIVTQGAPAVSRTGTGTTQSAAKGADIAAKGAATAAKGKGIAEFTLNPATKELTWKISYEGLTGNPFRAYIAAPAEPGNAAPAEKNLAAGDIKDPIEGRAKITNQQADDIISGKTYVSIQTVEGGFIRGQITKSK